MKVLFTTLFLFYFVYFTLDNHYVNCQLHRPGIFQNVYNWFNGNKGELSRKSGLALDRQQNNVAVKASSNNTWINKVQNAIESLAKDLEQKIVGNPITPQSVVHSETTNRPDANNKEPIDGELEEVDQEEELERCEMLNGTIGYCQPTKHCVMQEPEQRKFAVCKWSNGQEERMTRSPPEKLCCPNITVSLQELKHNFEQWLEQSKKEMFAAGLPKKPDGHCGVTSIEPLKEIDLRYSGQSDEYLRHLNQVRIVLGKSVELGQIPWMVAIYYRDQFLCGGSIISQRHILTAAHCLSANRNPQDYIVRYESVIMFNGTLNQVQSFIIHEDYAPPAIYHDIAIVTLSTPIEFNSRVQPVCLPGKRMYNELMIGQRGFVSGFGDLSFGGTQATLLQEVDIKVINNTFCDLNYRKLQESGRKFRHGIGKSLICAGYKDGGKDACQGDSGGPLTMNYRGANYLVGIVSFGYRCALPKFPGVYTCVAHYLPWIFENLQV